MDKEAIRQRIVDLVRDFRADYKKHEGELEANTETKLVEPLFAALGWTTNDFEKQGRALREARSGRVDYAFKIGDRTVFFLEVKRLGVELEKEADRQVISYALSRRIPFAVSTNFESLKIFCVEQENALNNVFRVFKRPEEYIDNLHDLLYLHKESFQQNLLMKKAEDEGRLKKRISINKPLLEDLMGIRNMIANDIEKRYPGKYSLNERDEIIQRIIDRLIFVRKCEDVGINPDEVTLEEVIHNPYGKAYSRLKEIFRRYDITYNSGLFAVGVDSDCDKIEIDGYIVQKLLERLYGSRDGQYVYNFQWIDADILGQVYEQYLGKILAQTKTGKSRLANGQAHRREEGIFYTPTFVVDFIVTNTLERTLRDKRGNINSIKVVDPACGSGSFLIRSFDILKSHYYLDDGSKIRRIDEQGMYSVKTAILKDNLFGVDLDPKAVEITKLNLLLKAAEKFRRLPEDAELHIVLGNSLIEDETVAGLSAFKWEGAFQEGSFDVVIGNPPYIQLSMDHEISERWGEYLISRYGSSMGRLNTFGFFLKLGINLLRSGGRLGFIVPNTILTQDYYEELRKIILRSCEIEAIVSFSDLPFKDAVVENVILVLRKSESERDRLQNRVAIYGIDANLQCTKLKEIPQKAFMQSYRTAFNIHSDKASTVLRRKIESGSTSFGEFMQINQAIALKHDRAKYLSKQRSDDTYKRVIDGRHINRYSLKWGGDYLRYDVSAIHSCKREDIFLSSHKLFFRRVGDKLIATLDTEQLYALNTLIVMNRKPDVSLDIRYLLGLFNSRLMNFFYTKYLKSTKKVFSEIQTRQVKNLPVKVPDRKKEALVVERVDRMLALNKRLNELGDKKTIETAKIEAEIRKVDEEIDGVIFEVYGLTEKEIQVVRDFAPR